MDKKKTLIKQIELLGLFSAEPITLLLIVVCEVGISHKTIRKAHKLNKAAFE